MSKQTKYPKYDLLGVEVDALTKAQAVDYISGLASDPESKALYVVKPYVEFSDQAAEQSEISQLLNKAELCLPDGVAIVWGTHYLYGTKRGVARLISSLIRIVINPRSLRKPLPEVFRGIDFTTALLKECERRGLSVYLIGSPKKSSISDTAAFIRTKYPKLKISGHFTGRLNDELEHELISSLRSLLPDIILVGMGFPAQERLMSRLQDKLRHGVMIGEGGSFDFRALGGKLPRAPRFMRVIHLEWLWRLLIEPWRLSRQIAIVRHIKRVYRAGKKSSS